MSIASQRAFAQASRTLGSATGHPNLAGRTHFRAQATAFDTPLRASEAAGAALAATGAIANDIGALRAQPQGTVEVVTFPLHLVRLERDKSTVLSHPLFK
ncbi:MAG: hypothetical protein QF921_04865 [Pseudomonadales bacterium]|jgi:hypothetical protein|nr:hypothetical protein [Pseudomonadales bacterium]MDP6471841.1 hypothetical protein [Pseudomonadales bacterium]MDP6826889.1 hypothetical protein [Pseudomonadales bacterium]MDP6970833.1 hypothetical protein [Pseudomonadales bacterium]